ncbi:D-glycero-beta-D-manno-heptose 1,7-bisphosphate 7-phosphatase [Oceanisphaera arctica]|uniref:D,D-heptose 1,7-bisphosphate phosphatase n=1 Tax=Oceanisphaera arctica TaxID=641510 RepID=A0A2P5TKB0_9GAMM|nr:D-glycero-beta-D-manno-heptose 1,7-bisphosphate 7-phosphatase [Oceanisphaera arctica]PPL15561.1 D-glycero-beta-D-manno-heptose-1,7-bisphosphate 7-phosphatase [Oceanisphaera arctica]GHA25546.1 D,D-heptose 1,7-bisphosphate phosphatase [Oceanisphaera arctica]
MTTAAIFLDRDGVINQDTGYVSHSDDFIFIDGVIGAMKQLKQKGYQLVVVTNQSGIARGLFSEDDFIRLTEWMDWSLADRGVDLDGIYFCPHHPTEGSGPETQVCDCRKPAPGMFLEAAQELNINLADSYMVGDKVSDMKAAEAAGVGHKILVRTGKDITAEGEALAEAVYPSLVEFAQNAADLT